MTDAGTDTATAIATDPEGSRADPAGLDERMRVAAAACRTSLVGHGRTKPAERLAQLAALDLGAAGEEPDFYGRGGVVTELEAEVADLLGKRSAVFMPSGVMAQQCVLRVWADRRASPRVAVHAMSHFVVHELSALETLHRLQVEHLCAEPRPPTVEDLARLPGRLGAVSIELPLRDAGHRLPEWTELEAFAAACRERDTPLHIDGARLWESVPYWGRTVADVASLADSVYVSFYKGLNGLAGAAVAGPVDVMDEARRWQKRHGGVLVSLLPYAVSARAGLHRYAPQMGRYHEVALQVAAELTQHGLRVVPDPPHTNAFLIYVPEPVDVVRLRLTEHMESTHEVVARGAQPADVPGWSTIEFTVGEATCALAPEDVARRLARVTLGPSA